MEHSIRIRMVATIELFVDCCMELLINVCFKNTNVKKRYFGMNQINQRKKRPIAKKYVVLNQFEKNMFLYFSCGEQLDAKELATKVICISNYWHQRFSASAH